METIKVTDHTNYIEVQLNRPEVKNAFNQLMISELTDFFVNEIKETHRFVVISAAGESFSAGADLNWMKSMASETKEVNEADASKLFDLFYSIYSCTLPVVSKVSGYVMGGGNGLVAASDIVIADADTKFAFTEVKLGLVPATISPFVMRKVKGSFASDTMLTGRMFSAKEAFEAGLVSACVEADNMSTVFNKTISRLLSSSPQALKETKRLIRLETADPLAYRVETSASIAAARVSEEGQIGMTAFFEKSKPVWVL